MSVAAFLCRAVASEWNFPHKKVWQWREKAYYDVPLFFKRYSYILLNFMTDVVATYLLTQTFNHPHYPMCPLSFWVRKRPWADLPALTHRTPLFRSCRVMLSSFCTWYETRRNMTLIWSPTPLWFCPLSSSCYFFAQFRLPQHFALLHEASVPTVGSRLICRFYVHAAMFVHGGVPPRQRPELFCMFCNMFHQTNHESIGTWLPTQLKSSTTSFLDIFTSSSNIQIAASLQIIFFQFHKGCQTTLHTFVERFHSSRLFHL